MCLLETGMSLWAILYVYVLLVKDKNRYSTVQYSHFEMLNAYDMILTLEYRFCHFFCNIAAR